MADNPLGAQTGGDEHSVEAAADAIKAQYNLDGYESPAETEQAPEAEIEPGGEEIETADAELEPEAPAIEEAPEEGEQDNDLLETLRNEAEDPEAEAEEIEGAEAPDAEDNIDGIEPGESLAIDAPISWPEAAKEAFRALPPETQEIIATREGEREKHLSEKGNELAEVQRETSEHLQAVISERQHYANTLAPIVQSLGADLEGSQARLDTLFETYQQTADPEDQVAYETAKREIEANRARFEGVRQEQARINHQQQQEAQNMREQSIRESSIALMQKIPEWADDKLAAKEITELREFVSKHYEVKPEVANGIYDQALIRMARDAKAYQALQSKAPKAKAKLKGKPPVTKPGTVSNKADIEAKANAAKVTNLRQSGSTEGLADVLKGLGI